MQRVWYNSFCKVRNDALLAMQRKRNRIMGKWRDDPIRRGRPREYHEVADDRRDSIIDNIDSPYSGMRVLALMVLVQALSELKQRDAREFVHQVGAWRNSRWMIHA